MIYSADDFDTLTYSGRKSLMASFMYQCQKGLAMTPMQAARELTDYAVANGFTQPRKPIPGESLRSWSDKGQAGSKVPLWAVETALDYLLNAVKAPVHGEAQLAVVAMLLYRAHGDIDAALAALPDALHGERDQMLALLHGAKAARDAFLARLPDKKRPHKPS